jgi:hypothetical protein
MKKLITMCAAVTMILAAGSAYAGFYAQTNELGYQGTIWNITENTGPWTTATPRDAALYTVVGYKDWSDYNYLLSNWSEHSVSNTNNSFLQLAETDNASVTSATANWDSTLKIFTATVSGANAPYPWSRFWQPDNGVAWGVTFTNYTYTFTATFAQEAAIDIDGWLSNTVNPDTIEGSFTGEFVVTADIDKSPITNGDTYGFDITFSKAMFVPLDNLDAYGNPTSVYNSFGVVPEPATMVLLGLGGLSLIRRKR